VADATLADILKIVLGGFVGGIVGPLVLEEYRRWRHERAWKRPRKELLKRLLEGPLIFRSIDTLARTVGTSPDECRSLLIEIGARGAIMKDRREAWALISRAPLKDVSEEEVAEDFRRESLDGE
jgi:hypothetical protein